MKTIFSKQSSESEKNFKKLCVTVISGLATSKVISPKLLEVVTVYFDKANRASSEYRKKVTGELIKLANSMGFTIYKPNPNDKLQYTYAAINTSNKMLFGIKDDLDPSALAHELGHYKVSTGEAGNFLKKNHDLVINVAFHEFCNNINKLNMGYSVGSGLMEARQEIQGKKPKWFTKYGHLIIPTLTATPELINEAMASKEGMKICRDIGMGPQDLAISRKLLGAAFLSYLFHALGVIVANHVFHLIAKYAYKAIKLHHIEKLERLNKQESQQLESDLEKVASDEEEKVA